MDAELTHLDRMLKRNPKESNNSKMPGDNYDSRYDRTVQSCTFADVSWTGVIHWCHKKASQNSITNLSCNRVNHTLPCLLSTKFCFGSCVVNSCVSYLLWLLVWLSGWFFHLPSSTADAVSSVPSWPQWYPFLLLSFCSSSSQALIALWSCT